MSKLATVFPILDWGCRYSRVALIDDVMAALLVTIMLIPQSLAYALLAGLPAEVGLYASILPLFAYALFGTSRVLAVGPVAVVSLMTATAITPIAAVGTAEYATAAMTLALLSGAILLVMGILNLGFIANLLSHPVISAFITASGILIALGQLGSILGIQISGKTLSELLPRLVENLPKTNAPTLALGLVVLGLLFWFRNGLVPSLVRLGLPIRKAELVSKAAPILVVGASIFAVVLLGLDSKGVKTVGRIPQGLPHFSPLNLDLTLWAHLVVPALLISLIGFVESVSVAQTLAAKRRQRIAPNQELIALGSANLASAFSGGFPVTGGFARSVVNFDAGAQTPAAGAFTAVGITFVALFLTPLLTFLPIATLGATIIVAVTSLIDFKIPRILWRYSKSDFVAFAITITATLMLGVELGVIIGVGVSLALLLWRSSHPHAAIVGRVPGTQHFRNVTRHHVTTVPQILTIRIDEALTYLNARWLEEFVLEQVSEHLAMRHLILMCSAVNAIDASALESLEAINHRLADGGVKFHLSEVKGPVLDRLKRSPFLDDLTGQVWLSQNEAFETLAAQPIELGSF